MIAGATFDHFADLLAELGRYAPPDSLPAADPEGPPPTELLDPRALPPDPAACCITAVIDHAIPFAHPLLRTAEGLSRVAAVWLQDAPCGTGRADIAFGRELTGREIDALARPGEPEAAYRAAGVLAPQRRGGPGLMRAGTHGAAVAGLAAGFAPGDPAGRAHPVIAVSLPGWSVADSSGASLPLFIQAGVVYVVNRARILSRQLRAAAPGAPFPPVVVNLSLGALAGARDGSSLIERLQDIVTAVPEADLGPVHFVLPTGNARLDRLHGTLGAGEAVDWVLPPDDPTPSILELRCPAGAAAPIAVELTLPDGTEARSAFGAAGGLARFRDAAGREIARLTLERRDGAALGAQCLTVIVPPTRPEAAGGAWVPAGRWRVRLGPGSPAPCSIDLQRDERIAGFRQGGRQSRFADPDYAWRAADGRLVAEDADPPKGRLRRRGTSNAYAGGAQQLRVGAAAQRGGLPAPAALGPGAVAGAAAEGGGGGRRRGRGLSPYSALLADGSPGELVAPVDRGPGRPGRRVPGCGGWSTQMLGGSSLAAPQATRWLAALQAALPPQARLRDRQAVRAAALAGEAAPGGVAAGRAGRPAAPGAGLVGGAPLVAPRLPRQHPGAEDTG